jgi:hypothetical protein
MLCRGKRVVEFGIGGSTIILHKVAKNVITYEHDQAWVDKIMPLLPGYADVRLIDKAESAVVGLGSPCDVLFDDGHSILRAPALLEFWPDVKECAILHDSRMTYAGNCVKKFIDAWTPNERKTELNPNMLPDNLYTGSLDTIHWNYLESNMVVLKKRSYVLKYENWNIG